MELTRHNVTPDECFNSVFKHFNKKFIWGKTDCCKSVNEVHKELTGIGVALDYDNKISALRLIRKGGDLVSLVEGKLLDGNFIEVDRYMTCDIAILNNDDNSKKVDQQILGIAIQDNQWAVKSEFGFYIKTNKDIIRAYRCHR